MPAFLARGTSTTICQKVLSYISESNPDRVCVTSTQSYIKFMLSLMQTLSEQVRLCILTHARSRAHWKRRGWLECKKMLSGLMPVQHNLQTNMTTDRKIASHSKPLNPRKRRQITDHQIRSSDANSSGIFIPAGGCAKGRRRIAFTEMNRKIKETTRAQHSSQRRACLRRRIGV